MAAIPMRMSALLIAVLAVLPVAGAQAAPTGPGVQTMVVGRTHTLVAPRFVRAGALHVRASGRRCAVATGTPLGALAATGISFSTRDQGACSARAVDSSALYVFQIGPDRGRGSDGWVYKVDGRAGTTSAADSTGAFGTGRRLRAGQRVLWFWCRMRAAGCQRTLEVRPAAGGVRVLGRDDAGRAKAIAGAAVRAGVATVLTDARGFARTDAAGVVTATAPGLVPAFPVRLA